MLTKVPTLSGRLTKSIVQFTALLLLFFAGLVIFLVYALEDATFTLHLKQAANDLANGNPISPHIQHLKDLNHYQISLPPLVDLNDHSFGEFRYLGSYFHYMQIDKGVLLMKADDLLYVSRGLKDILLLLALVFSPVLLLCIPLAKKLSSHALKPFDELCDLFVGEQKQHQDTNNVISNIAEQDVKAIASKLQEALDDKARLLQEQIVFNQGMSHEIRTPLQVMTHSLELLSATTPELSEKKSFKRLQKSAQRTQRISEALLWLTSEEKFQGLSNAEQAVKEILEQSVDLLKAHQLTVNLRS